MYILIIFIILTSIEAYYLWSKWDQIQEYKEIGQEVANFTRIDQDHRYKTMVQILGNLWNYAKPMFYVLGVLLVFANILLATVIGTIIHFFI